VEGRFDETHIMELGMEDRRNLCHSARLHVSNKLHFLNHNVPEAQSYEFQYDHGTETAVAIPCPTLPQLYLRVHSGNEYEVEQIELILQRSFIDNYYFETEIMIFIPVLPGKQQCVIPMLNKYLHPMSR